MLADKIADLGKPTSDNYCKWEKTLRSGVPDQHKRQMLLFFFGITQIDAQQRYTVAQEQAGSELVEACKKVRIQ